MSLDENERLRAGTLPVDPIEGTEPVNPPPTQTEKPCAPEVRYEIRIDETNVTGAIEMAVEVVSKAPEMFVRGGVLTEVVKDKPPARYGIVRDFEVARPHTVAPARLFEVIASRARVFQEWVDSKGNSRNEVVYPPGWLVSGVMARGSWPQARPLSAVVETPTLRPDGSLLSAPGYDKATGVFLQPTVEVNVPNQPSMADVEASVSRLMDLLCDFPMTAASKSVVIAAICTIVARSAVVGNVPMFLFDASTPGSGKGLLADVVNIIALGRKAAIIPCSQDDEEQRKVITSIILMGDSVAMFDNVDGRIGSASLDAAITGEFWTDRVLGKSEMTMLPVTTVFLATGNNLAVGGDLARRALVARVVPDVERPEQRDGFKYMDLKAHVRGNRGKLLGDVLTLLRGYVCAGRPNMKLKQLGSFEEWSAFIRSAVVWAGLVDPVTPYAADDSAIDALVAVMDAWPAFDDKPFTAAELVSAASVNIGWRDALVGLAPPRRGDIPTSQDVGYALKKAKDRIVAGCKIVMAPKVGHKTRWQRIKVETNNSSPYSAPIDDDPPGLNHVRKGDTFDVLCGSNGGFATGKPPSCPKCIRILQGGNQMPVRG